MDKPQNTVSIPESITINGVTYVVKDTPELLNFMQTVAKVEKNKLYSQFETLKEQIAKLAPTIFCIHGNHEQRPANIPSYKAKE